MKESMQKLRKILSECHLLNSSIATLLWDQETHLVRQGFDFRGKQVAYLSRLAHEKFTSSEMSENIEKLHEDLEQGEHFSFADKVIIREVYKDYTKQAKVPSSLVEKKSQTIAQAQFAWLKARQENSFSFFAPPLQELMEISIAEVQYINPDKKPYEVMLEEYEPGISTEKLDSLFYNLKKELIPLVEEIIAGNQETSILSGSFPEGKQDEISMRILQEIGFSFDRGRMDESVHPLTIELGPQDVRITSKYHLHHLEGIYSSIHEGGHGIYEQGLNPDFMGTPMGSPTSLAIHESQSRLWEVFIGKSKSFIFRYFTHFQNSFPQLRTWTQDQFYRAINRVATSPIRIDSDELTYHLHVITRYEIEKDVFEGRLAVSEIPEAWNAKMKSYLGLEISSDVEGALQDIHWSQASFGYFPTYTLGSMYAAQLWDKLRADIPDLGGNIMAGDFHVIHDWLNRNIFRVGKATTGIELIESLTGQKLSEQFLLEYFRRKWEQGSDASIHFAS